MTNGSLTIKLISPRMSLRPMDSELKRRMSPPLSLVTIASLTPKEHNVYIEDENIAPLNLTDTPDLVGITVNVDTAYRAFSIADGYRKKGVKVVFGGIHASACPEEMYPHCDTVCIGEAEKLWLEILRDCESGELKKVYAESSPIDMSLVPIPQWDFVRKKKYLYHNVVVASRGCPFKCEFCYNSCSYVQQGYRHRPVNNVIEEVKRLNVRQVMFIDDNLIGNIAWTEELVAKLAPLKLMWHAAVSANIVNHPELISRMAASGCRSLFVGFESINPDSVKSVNKLQNKTGEYESLIGMLHSNGIMVNASLVFGFDDDTRDVFDQTLEWLVKNKVETMTAHILTPYPGTKLYKRLVDEGRITCNDLSRYNTSNVVFRPKNFSEEELKQAYLNMYKRFYTFRNILRRRPADKRRLAPYFLFNFGYRKFGRCTSLFGSLGFMTFIGKLARRLSYNV